MRYLKPFTFYPGEWAPPVVSDGCLEISLDLEAIWSAPYVFRELETLCTRLEDENETLKEQIATLLEKLNGR